MSQSENNETIKKCVKGQESRAEGQGGKPDPSARIFILSLYYYPWALGRRHVTSTMDLSMNCCVCTMYTVHHSPKTYESVNNTV